MDFPNGQQDLTTVQLESLVAQGFFSPPPVNDPSKCDNSTFTVASNMIRSSYPFKPQLAEYEKILEDVNNMVDLGGSSQEAIVKALYNVTKPQVITVENCRPEQRDASVEVDRGCANGTIPYTSDIVLDNRDLLTDIIKGGADTGLRARRRQLLDLPEITPNSGPRTTGHGRRLQGEYCECGVHNVYLPNLRPPVVDLDTFTLLTKLIVFSP